MKNHRALRRLRGWLALLLALVCLSVPAYAISNGEIDMEREGSIELRCVYNKEPVSGGNLLLVQVASPELDDGKLSFRLCDALGGARLTQKELDNSSLAGELAAQAGLQSLDSREESLGADGVVRFENVTPGLYLLRQTKSAPGFERLGPILVSVPFKDPKSGEYTYEVDATGKLVVEREVQPTPSPSPSTPPASKQGYGLPQTGQLNWPLPALVGGGILLILLGLWLLVLDFRRSRQ